MLLLRLFISMTLQYLTLLLRLCFSGPVTFSAPVENVAPAPVVTSTPALSGESCFDELRGATEVPTVRFRLHDEWLHAERVLRARAARRGYFFR